ncbi:hypothetical protein BS78_K246300 [Paspalum vaginatum]|uniref:Uncharacterized protein n=1 Tax=Paspalum vaginatum TaxID=158149 RepID=A0A9W7XAJ3_9POAL|nr:hypothetical protein BS78_K246300 [Paspalum vaginatum]
MTASTAHGSRPRWWTSPPRPCAGEAAAPPPRATPSRTCSSSPPMAAEASRRPSRPPTSARDPRPRLRRPASVPPRHRRGVPPRRVVVGPGARRAGAGARRHHYCRVPHQTGGHRVPFAARAAPPRLGGRGLGAVAGRHGAVPKPCRQSLRGRREGGGREGLRRVRMVLVPRHRLQRRRRPQLPRRVPRSGGGEGRRRREGRRLPALALHKAGRRALSQRERVPARAWCHRGCLLRRAWSPGVVSRALGEGEFEVKVVGKNNKELVETKVMELLKPRYKWNGKHRKIVSAKRRTNWRRRSMSGKSPSLPVDVTSSGDEQMHGPESFGAKRSRKELKQRDATSTNSSEHALPSEIVTPLSALHKSPESSLPPNSGFSEKNSSQVLSHGTVNSVPINDLLHTPGHSTPQIESAPKKLKKKMASARRNSAVQQTQKKLLSVKKGISKSKVYKIHPVRELQGKDSASDNLKGNTNASMEGQTPSRPDRQVSRQTRRGSSKKVFASNKLANRKGSKQLCSPHSSLNVTGTVQQMGRKKVAEPMKESPLPLGSTKSITQEQICRTLDDTPIITQLSNQEGLFSAVPPGFESMYNGKGVPTMQFALLPSLRLRDRGAVTPWASPEH